MTKLLRVLNLEDNPHDSMLLKRFLSKQHFSLTFLAVANEADFKEALKKFDWDIILADYTVPGFEAPLALKFLRRTGRDIPLIVLSGEMGEDVAVNVMRAGAADFILKDRMARLVPAIERELQEAGNRHERKRAETARLQTEARLRAILDHSPAAIYMKDRAGRYVLANRVCSDVFGTPSSEVLGKTDLELYPEPLAKSLRESDRRVIREGRPIQVEQQSAGDQQKDYLSVKFPVYDEKASVLGVGGIATDITSFKRTEEALRRSEKLATAGRLAATIAHEINNPLEAVVNILFLLARDENLPDRARELVAIAE